MQKFNPTIYVNNYPSAIHLLSLLVEKIMLKTQLQIFLLFLMYLLQENLTSNFIQRSTESLHFPVLLQSEIGLFSNYINTTQFRPWSTEQQRYVLHTKLFMTNLNLYEKYQETTVIPTPSLNQ